ncbi:uncharacterized protein TM35_000561280, partial [Trypanosoma theileri]
MQVRRVLYFLALIMSVASVCVAAAEAGNSRSSSSSSSTSVDKCLPPPETDAAVERTADTLRDTNTYCANQRPSNASPAGSGNDGSVNPPPPP